MYVKGFQRFHISKNVRPPTPFSFYERDTTKKKTQWKIRHPDDVFSENPVKIDFTGSVTEGRMLQP